MNSTFTVWKEVVFMRLHKNKRRRSLYVICVLFCQLFVGILGNQNAYADSPVTDVITVDDMAAPYGLLTNVDGSVTVSDCGGNSGDYDYSAFTYDDMGNIESSVEYTVDSQDFICNDSSTQDAYGTIYYLRRNLDYEVSVVSDPRVGTSWIYELECSASYFNVNYGLVLGADGNIYVLSTCVYYDPVTDEATYDTKILSFSPTGSLRFSITVDQERTNRSLKAYSSGLVYLDNTGEFHFYGYDGVEDVSKKFSPSAPEAADYFALSWEGRIYYTYQSTDENDVSACYLYDKAIGLSGVSRLLSEYCPRQQQDIQARPNGGVVFVYQASEYNQNDEYIGMQIPTLVMVDGDGSINTFFLDHPNDLSVSYYEYRDLLVDMNGNIAVLVNRTDGDDNFSTVWLVSSQGFELGHYDTKQFATTSPDGFDGIKLGMANGSIFFTTYCSGMFTCGSANPGWLLFKVPAPGVTIDYPRAAFLGVSTVITDKIYAALGDSFSSGEANSPYVIGTDISGTNMCHRSLDAYPALLASDSSMNLSMTLPRFVACSGATTDNILTSGQYDEDEQLSILDGSTDVVTVSIGGNNVGFANFARDCIISGCAVSNPTGAYATIMDKITSDLYVDLTDTYVAIRDSAPNAHIYVVGYPHLAPIIPPLYACVPLTGAAYNITDYSDSNIPAVLNVTNALNAEIQIVVDDFKLTHPFAITFIDPSLAGSSFEEHDLCSGSSSYFNSVDTGYIPASFHPNVDGQLAYAELLKPYLQ